MNNFVKFSRAKMLTILVLALMLVISGCSLNVAQKTITPDEAKAKAEKFINENLLSEGTKATIGEVTKEDNLYKLVVEVNGGQKVDSFMSLDGTKFYPQVMNIDEVAGQKDAEGQQDQAAADQQDQEVPKNDKPVVELFVMSHCPYGTQIEKGIIPAVQALGNKIDFQLKFCDYAMHGEKEVKEQLNQTCIAKEQKDKLFGYLNCFLKEGNSDACLKEAKIDTAKMKSCTDKLDKEFSVLKKLNDKSSWISGQFPPFEIFGADNTKYGVKGSPTLVVNGVQSTAGRDSASLLGAICSGFNNKPAECDKQLSAAAPSPGFGTGTDTSGSNASCE